jgi:hypothetical protein
VFSNRAYGWKLTAALFLIAGLGVYAARKGESINPPLWRCVVEPKRWDDTTLWLPFARIASVGEGTFEVDATDARIRVIGKAPAGVGSTVTLRGVFRANGPHLELIDSRALPPDLGGRRRLMEVVSILVVLIVLANFIRHFYVRPKVLQVHAENGNR